MAVLITQGDNYGSRRCDGHCHDAKSGRCACICGGANHGAGLAKAMENTAAMAVDIARKAGLTLQIPIPGNVLTPIEDVEE